MELDYRFVPVRLPFGVVRGAVLLLVIHMVDVFPREPQAVMPWMVGGFEIGQGRVAGGPYWVEKRLALVGIETELPQQVGAHTPCKRVVCLEPNCASHRAGKGESEQCQESFTENRRRWHSHGCDLDRSDSNSQF